MAGNANSGRHRKSISRADAMRSLTQKVPAAVNLIAETMEGINTDRLRYDAAITIKEAVLGKASQATSLEISGGDDIGGGLLSQLFTIMQVKRKELDAPRLETPKLLDIPVDVKLIENNLTGTVEKPTNYTHNK